ncbi:hypothetical protein EBU02_10865 [bacterium]|jgi:hypothetical protein|nr:hypothetical protein [bacterium]NBS52630.1 hypothetical protein [Spartobacteria bacterium]
MPNKKLLAGILGLFIAALTLLAFLVFFQKEETISKGFDTPFASSNKTSTPTIEISPPPTSTPSPKPKIKPPELAETDPISEVLSNENLDLTGAVNKLLEMLPKLDAERQSEAAHHIANLSDDAVCPTWSKMVTSNSLPQPAAEVLFNDMLNRPHELLMPFLGSIADQPAHPLHRDSTDVLEALFGQPPQGTPWSVWVKNSQLQESSGR